MRFRRPQSASPDEIGEIARVQADFTPRIPAVIREFWDEMRSVPKTTPPRRCAEGASLGTRRLESARHRGGRVRRPDRRPPGANPATETGQSTLLPPFFGESEVRDAGKAGWRRRCRGACGSSAASTGRPTASMRCASWRRAGRGSRRSGVILMRCVANALRWFGPGGGARSWSGRSCASRRSPAGGLRALRRGSPPASARPTRVVVRARTGPQSLATLVT